MQLNNERKPNTVISSLQPGHYGDDPLATVRLPQRGLCSQPLGKYWQLSQNNHKTGHTATKTNNT